MKKIHNKLTCLFGHHDYSDEPAGDKYGTSIHLCKICKRSGYKKWDSGNETWYTYGEKGNLIHSKWGDGSEFWFDEKGNWVHDKYPDGHEYWKGNDGYWVSEKPKNWKYEKYLQ